MNQRNALTRLVPKRPLAIVAGMLAALAMVSAASAQEEDPVADLAAAVDAGWMMLAAFLVFFMQAGFAMVESGFTRAKNTTNILMKNTMDACIGGLAFWAVGWGIAYGFSGDSTSGWFGNGHFFLASFDDYTSFIFQFAFAATAATIVSGVLAERTKLSTYLIVSALMTGIIYPVVVHWTWDGNGWLSAFAEDPIGGNGYVDFAGSGIVHMVGGVAGLVGALFVGPRIGKYGPGKRVNPIPGHSVSLAALGMFILWVGWYGFNPGSTLGLSGGLYELAARVAVTTTLAAAAGGMTIALVTRATTGRYDYGLTINGVLAGLVAVTAPTATIDPWAAVVIGAIGGLIMLGGVTLLDNLKIDDPVGAVPVHGFAGLWGVLAVGLFSSQDGMASAGYADPSQYGLLLGGGAEQLGIQALGAVSIIAWTAVASGIVFGVLKVTMGLRVGEEEENKGLDLFEHGMEAYPEFAPAPVGPFGTGLASALMGEEPATRPAPSRVDRPAEG